MWYVLYIGYLCNRLCCRCSIHRFVIFKVYIMLATVTHTGKVVWFSLWLTIIIYVKRIFLAIIRPVRRAIFWKFELVINFGFWTAFARRCLASLPTSIYKHMGYWRGIDKVSSRASITPRRFLIKQSSFDRWRWHAGIYRYYDTARVQLNLSNDDIPISLKIGSYVLKMLNPLLIYLRNYHEWAWI